MTAPAPKGRLGNGQLRRQVAEWLAARPGPCRCRPHGAGVSPAAVSR
jgi:hypothetical protein